MDSAREPIEPKACKKGRRTTVGERRMQLGCMTIPELIADIRKQGVALAFGAVEILPNGREKVHLVIDAPGKYLKWAAVNQACLFGENLKDFSEFRTDAFHELKKRCICFLGAFIGRGGEVQLARSPGVLAAYLRFQLSELYEDKNVSRLESEGDGGGTLDDKDDDEEIEPCDPFNSKP